MTWHYTDAFLRRDTVYVRGYANGKRFKDKIEYEPFLFVPSKTGEYRTLENAPLEKKSFQTITSARDFLKSYEGVSNFPIYGNPKFLYQYLNQDYPDQIEYDPSAVKQVFIDIEVVSESGFPQPDVAEEEIISICLLLNDNIILFGTKPYKPKSNRVKFLMCKDEVDLIKQFLLIWNSEEWSPDIITGWNIDGFDIPYLYNRIKRVLGEKYAKTLSPWRIVDEKEVQWAKDRTRQQYILRGIQSLDYIDLYKKFTFINHESFALNHIAHVELGEKKIDWSEYQSLTELYNKDYEKFIDYNIGDTVLVKKLDDKLGFLSQILFFAYDAKINFIDTLTTVNVWDVIITNYLMSKKIAVPQQVARDDRWKIATDEKQIVGGHVKEPKLGLSKWVVNFDFTSLYPHIVMGWNISPETMLGKNKINSIETIIKNEKIVGDSKFYKEGTITAFGCRYSKDKQGFFPALMEKMFNDRVVARKKLAIAKKTYQTKPTKELANEISSLDNLQKARKIQINAGYGAMANKYFRFFNSDMAESVTSTGQLAIQFTEKKINGFLNEKLKTKNVDYVVASDTDSLYITLEHMVSKVYPKGGDTGKIVSFLDEVCKGTIEPFLEQCFVEFAALTNAFTQSLHMKREVIADKAIWRGAKMYIMRVWDKEGIKFTDPEILIHGIEAVRSSTPMVCREKIKQSLKIILGGTEEELQTFLQSFRDLFFELPFEDIASPSSMNGMTKYEDSSTIYKLSTPIHVKGALIYNHYIREKNLLNKYEEIHDGNKVKYCYLTLPNPVKSKVITTGGRLPKELNLDNYLDRDLQFNRTFLSPIQSIIELIGWKTNKTSTLEGFF